MSVLLIYGLNLDSREMIADLDYEVLSHYVVDVRKILDIVDCCSLLIYNDSAFLCLGRRKFSLTALMSKLII